MSELRWILLSLGALFIAGLAFWELRRPRQAPRDGPEHRDAPPAPVALPQMRAREPMRELPSLQIHEPAEQVVVEVPTATLVPEPELVEPVVEWPPEETRRILTVRILAARERFAGRALRLALAAEGFMHGRLSIFHKPGSRRARAAEHRQFEQAGHLRPAIHRHAALQRPESVRGAAGAAAGAGGRR